MKKILALLLTICMTTSFFACGEKPDESSNSSSIEQSSSDLENSSDTSNAPQAPAIEMIKVSDILSAQLGTTNYSSQFNSTVRGLITQRFNIYNILSIEIPEFTIAKEGKIVFSVLMKNAKEPEVLEYYGDTTGYENFYKLANDKENYINEILQSQNLTIESEVEKDSAQHTALQSSIAQKVAQFTTQKNNFAQEVTADTLVKPEPPKPIEYVTVQSIVDEVFVDVDFDANLKETMTTLASTLFSQYSAQYSANKHYAFEYDVAENGYIKFYSDYQDIKTYRNFIFCFGINGDMRKYSNFLYMSDDYKAWIEKLTGKTLRDNVEKNSQIHLQLQAQMNELKQAYKEEKTAIEATPPQPSIEEQPNDHVWGTTVFSPYTLDDAKMAELGITSMNAFAQALLNNKNGEGYDKVTGWTSDDVIATYVGNFSSENIYGVNGFDFLIILNTGIVKTRIETTRKNSSKQVDLQMLLEDDNKVEVIEVKQVINWQNDIIVFDDNGKRI